MQLTITRLQPSEWPVNVPHMTFTLPNPHKVVEVHDVIELKLDGEEWLWQAVHWTSQTTSVSTFFETYDENGDTVNWVDVSHAISADIFWAVEMWFACEVGRTQVTTPDGTRTSVPWNGYTTEEGYDADDVEPWVDSSELPL
jgi:hypothetical protein